MSRPVRRWPLAPLLEVAGNPSVASLARRVDAHVRQAQRWAEEGGLTDLWADRAAIRLDSHPALIWPEWCDPSPDN
ncbi:MAG: hypothetical protein IT195_12515 [Microthrixaceae bacterium]|nr:hypothetical protein [Microthrixaceae bacterium]